MSELKLASGQLVVYDNVLSGKDFEGLLVYLNSIEYTSVHAGAWRKVWRLHDGSPLTSRAAWYHPAGDSVDGLAYPTATALDRLIFWITEMIPEVEYLVGKPGHDWERLSVAPWIYPVGSGLSLHQDGVLYSGAFTYFAHPQWRPHWGGHLMVLDASTPQVDPQSSEQLLPPFLDDEGEANRIFDPGLALSVFAKPNRIVFLSPTAQHLMTRVDVNAGQSARISVAGFFHKPPQRVVAPNNVGFRTDIQRR